MTSKKKASKKTSAKKTTVKKVLAKKTVKATFANKVVPFNRKNVLALADRIYSDKGGVITCLKLCDGSLSNGKDGGRTLHCAVGEAYFSFVNNDMKKLKGNTETAIEELVKVAQFSGRHEDNKSDLEEALNEAVSQNDDSLDDSDDEDADFILRSRNVAEVFRDQVAPLLK